MDTILIHKIKKVLGSNNKRLDPKFNMDADLNALEEISFIVEQHEHLEILNTPKTGLTFKVTFDNKTVVFQGSLDRFILDRPDSVFEKFEVVK